MLYSMTGYGRSELEDQKASYTAEIQCLNKRYLDISVQLPRALLSLEPKVKEWIRSKIQRGFVQVSIFVNLNERSSLNVIPNLPLIEAYKNAWDAACEKTACNQAFPMGSFVTNKDFFSCSDVFTDEEKVLIENSLSQVVTLALDAVDSMRLSEGEKIQEDLYAYLAEVENHAKYVPNYLEETKVKWKERLEKSVSSLSEELAETNQDRIYRELAILAEKMDVAEEIRRLGYHTQTMKELLDEPKRIAKGKRIEFIVQEMNREVNTLSSKSSHREIARLTIEMKSLLEKFREQVQNVE